MKPRKGPRGHRSYGKTSNRVGNSPSNYTARGSGMQTIKPDERYSTTALMQRSPIGKGAARYRRRKSNLKRSIARRDYLAACKNLGLEPRDPNA